ncbi:MAG: 3-isopropylmalate dehydratase large subunit [Deltaproteobacteria bacterium]|nr:3-isopropylmalate dehydratase large subunit [Deltaproteobacteria bacterium]MBW1794822.1 3-isopropylmalate dehydratase large subunit [Deltaproteobacteria bacterium]
MPQTITEKILAAHAGRDTVTPGELINVRIDMALANDITAPIAIDLFEKSRVDAVFDPERIALVPDHFVPNKDVRSAIQVQAMRAFARKYHIKYFFELGEMGIEHVLLPEQGLVLPGDVVIGADSHTCTYGALGAFATGVGSTDIAATMITGDAWFKVPESIKLVYHGQRREWVVGKDLILYTIGDIGVDGATYKAMEFTGDVIRALPVADRMTMANMAIEAGAKSGIISPDEATLDYIRPRAKRPFECYTSDPDATYTEVRTYDVSNIEPQVAFPYLPENTRGISAVDTIPIDQAVIGSCTNGRIEDLRLAARILNGRTIDKNVRLIIIPATPAVYRQAMAEGLLEIFLAARGIVSPPTCGPCLGGFMGILGPGERAVSTTNRNFVGRMGHPSSEVYLANPAVAAASAVLGRIGGPDEL